VGKEKEKKPGIPRREKGGNTHSSNFDSNLSEEGMVFGGGEVHYFGGLFVLLIFLGGEALLLGGGMRGKGRGGVWFLVIL